VPSATQSLTPEQRALQLSSQLQQARQDLASAHADLRNARSERDSLRAELNRARARIDELESGEKSAPSAPVPTLDPDMELRLLGRINELEAALSKARSASIPPAETAGDDLKRVRGIGPKFERLLKAEGVTTVSQIAAFSDAEIGVIAKKIGVKIERIRREDWIGNAKRLLESG
jgi:predicted flap endonuclease-1-like 5' DNA nuclease